MKPLGTSRKILTWFYLYPVEEGTERKKLIHFILSAVVFIFKISFLASSTAFFMKYVSTDLEESLYALFQISAFSNSTYVIAIAYISHQKITALIDRLSAIYDASKNF